jgi:Bacterial regulatory proteins, tetR family
LSSTDGIGGSRVVDPERAFYFTITLFCFIRYKISIRLRWLKPWRGLAAVRPMKWIGNLARPRAFDDDKVLDAAINCFWQRGLGATSVRDLTAEMGINGPSLYNAFGDKHAVFARALQRYAERSMRSTIRRLESGLAQECGC